MKTSPFPEHVLIRSAVEHMLLILLLIFTVYAVEEGQCETTADQLRTSVPSSDPSHDVMVRMIVEAKKDDFSHIIQATKSKTL